jgi:predicted metal-binding membrane protein
MAAMMFPAISPVVLLYNRLIKTGGASSNQVLEEHDRTGHYPVKMAVFVGSYLAVWSLTGLSLLLVWTIPMNNLLSTLDASSVSVVFGSILVLAGAYQFSPLKSKCLGYCESPMSLFMKRWRQGTVGALTMGTYHGLYCLGCCWPYFLIMVALGWMDILWMALFAGIIFGEKMWSRGIWVARAAGVGLAIVGALAVFGLIDISPTHNFVEMPEMGMPGMDQSHNDAEMDEMTPNDSSGDSMDMKAPGMKM